MIDQALYDARGWAEQVTRANGVVTSYTYSPERGWLDGLMTSSGAVTIQDLVYDRDGAGQIVQVTSDAAGETWQYVYDPLRRLTSASNLDDPGQSRTYAYDLNGNMTTGGGRAIGWSSFNKPTGITMGTDVATFVYGPDRARIKQVITAGASVTTVRYVGRLYETHAKSGSPDELVHYIRAARTVAIYTQVDDADPGTDKTRYLLRDHLDSVVGLTDELGAVTEHLSFDPHGARRAVDWQAVAGPIFPQETPRGFTGHEHLDGVELIHMNGRVYDPILGRFLSADPFVPYPLSTQGFDRYSYTNNNPLSFTDPSGFFFGRNPQTSRAAEPDLAGPGDELGREDRNSGDDRGDKVEPEPVDNRNVFERIADAISSIFGPPAQPSSKREGVIDPSNLLQESGVRVIANQSIYGGIGFGAMYEQGLIADPITGNVYGYVSGGIGFGAGAQMEVAGAGAFVGSIRGVGLQVTAGAALSTSLMAGSNPLESAGLTFGTGPGAGIFAGPTFTVVTDEPVANISDFVERF